jgi:NAD(P)-dependent dehydrogenase (short-subunit alcohol dehydrogenase family)
MSEDEVDDIMNANFKGAFFVVQAACKKLVASFNASKLVPHEHYARIINIASIGSITVEYNEGYANYCASKAALESLTRSIAQ